MDLLKRARDQRRRLLDEVAELEWFLQVADDLLTERYPVYEKAFKENAIQFGPILRIDKSDLKRLIVEEYRRK